MSHIELRDVRKSYRMGDNLITALAGVSLDIEAGEFVVILGPSGSGKTTLLNILGGLESPDSGTVMVGGDRGRQSAGTPTDSLPPPACRLCLPVL
ncbi:MAG TPA: ATP-binding cassette domain-containing protein [Aggregatilineaceae bacterium]|nr:ATP-binding cassette domain-containing protein [Aggregatilineaceae bacterium]